MSKEKNTNKDNFLFKDNKSIKELFENIPEKFYQNFSLIVLLMMIFLVVEQTVVRFVTQDSSETMYKNHFLYIGIIAIISGLLYVIGNCYKFKKGEFKSYLYNHVNDVLLIILLFWTIITSITGIHREESFFGSYFRLNGVRSYFIYAGLYICARCVFHNKKYKRIIIWMIPVAITIQNSLIIAHMITEKNVYRWGAFYNENHCAYVIGVSIALLMTLMVYEEKTRLKIIAGLLLFINIISLIHNNSFGPILANTVALIFFVVLFLIKNKKATMSLVMMLLVVDLSCFVGNEMNNNSFVDNFKIFFGDVDKLTDKDDYTEEEYKQIGTDRMRLWMGSCEIIKRKPIFGCGPENTREASGYISSTAHNEYLTIATENGIFAGILYILSLVILLSKKIKNIKYWNKYTLCIGTAVVEYLCSAFVGVMLYYSVLYYFILLGLLSGEEKE